MTVVEHMDCIVNANRLHVQQLINAAIVGDGGLQIKSIRGPGFNLGPLTQNTDTLLFTY